MSTRLFAVLFAALFLIGAFPILFIPPFGSASAGITAGFMLPAENLYHVVISISIGLVAAWAGGGVVLLLPLATLLMLAVGSLTEIPPAAFHPVHGFIVGGILLFALSISMIRHKMFLLYALPVSAWAYFSGDGFMQHIPPIGTSLFFLMGIIVSNALMLAIGVALGITVADGVRAYAGKLKSISPAFATFMSLF